MWEKETAVDRKRENIPLANLISQIKLSDLDPSRPRPRDWVGPIQMASEYGFVIIPEIKRQEPVWGSLRKRYDVKKLAKQMTVAGAPALSVNCDSVLFGGSIEDISVAREASSKAALESPSAEDGVIIPPILASDLVLYPYQLYSLRLAGADAVNLIVGALSSKDLLYLTKIAASLKLQVIASVTSEVQIDSVTKLSKGSLHAIVASNRDLESFSFDESGDQAINLLHSDAMQSFRNIHGKDFPTLVEGRVGIITADDGSIDGAKTSETYIKKIQSAGAIGAIVGGGVALNRVDDGNIPIRLMSN